jgi:hypothetical protein
LWYPFKKPGEISEVCVEQENALDSNFGNFLPQNIEMIRFVPHAKRKRFYARDRRQQNYTSPREIHSPVV